MRGARAALRAMVRVWIQQTMGLGVRIDVLSRGAVDTLSLLVPWPVPPLVQEGAHGYLTDHRTLNNPFDTIETGARA